MSTALNDASRGQADVGQEQEEVKGCIVTHRRLTTEGDGVLIHYIECGNQTDPLVVLLHGFPHFWRVWDRQLPALQSAGYHVVAPDLRGYACSVKKLPVKAYSRSALVNDIRALILKCGEGRPATLIDHDWGGQVAWAVAADYPFLVSRLIVLNSPHPDVFWKTLKTLENPRQMLRSFYIYLFQLPVVSEAFMRYAGEWVMRRLFQKDASKALPEEDLQRHLEAFRGEDAWSGPINYYRAAMRGLWLPPVGGSNKVVAPVLVIWGEKDGYIGSELAEPPRDQVPHTTLVRIPEASHFVMWDEPQLVNEHILKFLALTQGLAKI